MPFQIVHNDITKMKTDAIVNAANSHLQMGGGVCGAIFQAAGADRLQKECDRLKPCPVGESVLTQGYDLSARYIIHTVGPIWRGGNQNEEEHLRNAYHNSLKLAWEMGITSISFPLISSGIYGYPKEEALKAAVNVIGEFLLEHEMDVFLVVFDRKAVSLGEHLYSEVGRYLDTYFDAEIEERYDRAEFSPMYQEELVEELPLSVMPGEAVKSLTELSKAKRFKEKHQSLEERLNHMDETFSEMLLRMIDEREKTDVEVYKGANIDRKLFSKIRSNRGYHPKKSTVLAFAVSLELSLDEAKEFLGRAGYSLSMSYKFDVILQYFIEKKEYDIFLINETLFCFEQPLLGSL